jgi:hypothetical protein
MVNLVNLMELVSTWEVSKAHIWMNVWGHFQRWLALGTATVGGKTHPKCEQHHPIGWGSSWNKGGRRRKPAHASSILPEQVHLLLPPLPVDIRCQLLQLFNVDSQQWLSRDLQVLSLRPGLNHRSLFSGAFRFLGWVATGFSGSPTLRQLL